MKSSTFAAVLRGSAALGIGLLAMIAILTCAGYLFEAIARFAGVELGTSLGVVGPGSHFAMGFGVLRFGLQALIATAAATLLFAYVTGDLYSGARKAVNRLRKS